MLVLQYIMSGRYHDYLKFLEKQKEPCTVKNWTASNNKLVCKLMLAADMKKVVDLQKEWQTLKLQVEGVQSTSAVVNLECIISHNLLLASLMTCQENLKPKLTTLQLIVEAQLSKVCEETGVTVPQTDHRLTELCDIILSTKQLHTSLTCVHLLLYDSAMILLLNSIHTASTEKITETTTILKRLKYLVQNSVPAAERKDKSVGIDAMLCLPSLTDKPEITSLLPNLVDRLLCVCYFHIAEYTTCINLLQEIEREQPLSNELVIMKALLHWNIDDYDKCIETCFGLISNGHCESQLTARCHNLIGCCLAKKDKPQSAIQHFQLALNKDFEFLMPLYNVSLQYRKTGLYDAELEALNLIVMSLQNPQNNDIFSNGKYSSLNQSSAKPLLQYGLLKEAHICELQVLYTLARRCMELEKYEVGAQKYLEVIKMLTSGKSYECNNSKLSVPDLEQVYCEAAYCLLASGQYDECVETCDKVMGIIDDSMAEWTSCSDFATGADDDDDLMNILSDEPFVSLEVKKEIEKQKGLRKSGKRPYSSESGEHNDLTLYQVLLCKAECHVKKQHYDDALHCLSRITCDLEENIDFKHRVKQRKLDKDTKSRTDVELSILQTAHMNKAVVLTALDRLQQAIHSSRLAVQYNNGCDKAMYTHTLVLMKLHREREASFEWLNYRDIDVKQKTQQIQQLIEEKQTQLIRENRSSSSSQENNEEFIQLDICCLKHLLKQFDKNTLTWQT